MAILERLRHAINAHDLDAMLACIADDYQSEQPAHPNRGFAGRDQVRTNWGALLNAIPDLRVAAVREAVDGDTVWTEWHWQGQHHDETPFDMRGVTLFAVRDDRIVSGRLYVEETEAGGADIDATVRQLTHDERPPNEVLEA